ncbi:hypothetical protein FRB97_007672 [Tulasnella sp. 331]|nr:hypothetical protein FRB97_007672 [Tulasnella sp. 331]
MPVLGSSASASPQTLPVASPFDELEQTLPASVPPKLETHGHSSSNSTALSEDTWPLNIPPPELLHHLVETVFNCVPLATRLIHRATFMTNLAKPPSSPDFPHVNLLHAMSALASLYTPIVTLNSVQVNAKLHEGGTAAISAGFIKRTSFSSTVRYQPKKVEDIEADREYDFASIHAKWCNMGIGPAVQRGDSLIQQVQACIICCWLFHSRGKDVFASGWSKVAIDVLSSLGLSVSPGMEPLSRIPTQYLFSIPSSTTPIESELRRNIFWMAYSMERIFNASNVFPLHIMDEDCSQLMPSRLIDFNAGKFVPIKGRQSLFSHDMLLIHPRLSTDSFTLCIKATTLLGKVKVFNGRFRCRFTDGGDRQGRFPVGGPSRSSKDAVMTINPTDTDEFKALDSLIEAFTASIPREFNDPVGIYSGLKLDATLYMAHMIPHMAMIILHDPHANVFSLQDPSAARLLSATRAILDLIYKICGTTFDLLYLDHWSSTPWFMAGVTLIRFLNARTAQGDEPEIQKLTEELGAVK